MRSEVDGQLLTPNSSLLTGNYISIVEIEIVISSNTSSRTLTVSSAVKIVTLFSTAQRRISKPSVWLDWLEMSRVLIT